MQVKTRCIYTQKCWNCYCIQEFPISGTLPLWVGLVGFWFIFFFSFQFRRSTIWILHNFFTHGLRLQSYFIIYKILLTHTSKKQTRKRSVKLSCSTSRKIMEQKSIKAPLLCINKIQIKVFNNQLSRQDLLGLETGMHN